MFADERGVVRRALGLLVLAVDFIEPYTKTCA
jgi:hypothetical protein